MAPSKIAASVTVRAIGPAVSWLWAIGTIPDRLTRPTVGLIPTIPFAVAGQTIEPSVSVPIATAERFAATATPEPELDPHGLRFSAYGFRTRPPRPLQPLVEWVERKFAHSTSGWSGRGGLVRKDRKSTRLNSSHLVISYA